MRRVVVSVLILGVVALLTCSAAAQQRGRGMMGLFASPLMLLRQESVQAELKLTDEQKTKTDELATKARESFGSLRDLSDDERRAKMDSMRKANEKALAEILKPEQLKRVKQISVQQQGVGAFEDPEVAKTISLTDEQKTKIKTIQDDTQQAMREMFQPGTGFNEETQAKFAELRKSSTQKAVETLTPEQQAKWKELTGEEFKGKIVFRRQGGN